MAIYSLLICKDDSNISEENRLEDNILNITHIIRQPQKVILQNIFMGPGIIILINS